MPDDFISEGLAKILKNKKVFYNPAQKFNRDLTLLVIKEFIKDKKDVKIFEAMSASGLRGIRFIKEIDNNCEIFLNDMDSSSIESIKENFDLNDISKESENKFIFQNKKIFLTQNNCNSELYNNRNKFDVIDIDPFGCCTPFIDSALANIKNDGLLCLTSTDTSVLCSNKSKCYIKYNSIIMKTPACHKQSLRILLGYVCKAAGKFNKSIEPLVSVSVDFYVRIFLRVKNKNFKKSFEDISYYLFCSCFYMKEIIRNKNFKININKCENCGEKLNLCGPFLNKKISDKNFIENFKDVADKRMNGILNLICDEVDTFLFYSIPDLCSLIKKDCIPMTKMITALLNLNYLVSFSHCKLNSIKTNAPVLILYQIIRKYCNDEEIIEFGCLEIFKINESAKKIIEKNYYRNLSSSNLGPLALPKKNS
ncbi:tRNA methyltransferase 1 [Gurleya vavrai]